MRKLLAALIGAAILGAGVYLGAQPQTERIKVKIKLLDADTNKPITGIIRVSSAKEKYVQLPGLFDRMTGMPKDLPGVHWYCIPPDGADTSLPPGKLQIHAVSGLETALAKLDVDLKSPAEITIKLPFLFRPERTNLA